MLIERTERRIFKDIVPQVIQTSRPSPIATRWQNRIVC